MLIYYLKHLFRTIVKKPLQPLLVLFILTLSFIMSVLSFSVSNASKEEIKLQEKSSFGSSEIVIKTDSDSTSRFLIDEDVKKVVPSALVTGTFSIPYVIGKDMVSGVAVDFETVGDIFDLEFTDYDELDRTDSKNAIFITKDFSKKYSVGVGDSIKMTVFGQETEYTVHGVSDRCFVGLNDVLCSVTGIVDILAEQNPTLSLFTDDFSIYGSLFVKTTDGDVDGALQALEQEFSGFNVSKVAVGATELSLISLEIVGFIMLSLCFIGTFAVMYGCSYSMVKSRSEVSYLFNVSGVKQKSLLALRVAEMLFYGIIATLLGTVLSYPIGNACFNMLNIVYQKFTVKPLSFLLASLCIVAVSTVPTVLSTKSAVVKQKKKSKVKFVRFVFPIVAVAMLITVSVIKIDKMVIPSVIGAFASVFTVVVFAGPTVKALAKKIAKSRDTVVGISGKNFLKIGELINSSRLVSILMTIIISATVLIFATMNLVNKCDKFINADYVIAGANGSSIQTLTDVDGIDDVYGFYIAPQSTLNGNKIYVWGASDENAFTDNVKAKSLPQGNEAVCSVAYAGMFGLEKGDVFTIDFGTHSEQFVLSEVEHSAQFFFIIDPTAVGEKYNLYLVNGKEGVDDSTLYSNVVTALSMQMVSVTTPKSLLSDFIRRNSVYLYACIMLLVLLTVYGAVGVVNNLIESYRSRKDEFVLYSVAGMSKRNIKKMLTAEYLFTFASSLLIAVFFAALLTAFCGTAIMCYGGDIIQNFFIK